MDETTKPAFFCLLYDFLELFETFELLVKNMLVLFLLDLKLLVFDAVLLEEIGHLGCTVDHEREFVDDQKLEILRESVLTKAAILFPR